MNRLDSDSTQHTLRIYLFSNEKKFFIDFFIDILSLSYSFFTKIQIYRKKLTAINWLSFILLNKGYFYKFIYIYFILYIYI